MEQKKSTALRPALPQLKKLGLFDPTAPEILKNMGWNSVDYNILLWSLSRSANPDRALLALYRIWEKTPRELWQSLTMLLFTERTFRARLFAIFGASDGFVDHVIAHPQSLLLLEEDELPTLVQMQRKFQDIVKQSYGIGDLEAIGPKIIPALRTLYRDFLLQIAAHDLAATVENEPVLTLREVGGYLSYLADAAVGIALEIARLRITQGDVMQAPLMTIIALGKCGAHELNYVSDIDIVFIAEPANSIAERIASETVALAGLAFCAVDVGLRPEGRNGVLTRTVDSQLAYYENWAKTWEFQALLKARYMCGDFVLAQDYLQRVYSLIWQSSLREGFIDDIRTMKQRVEASVPQLMQERDIKLGGGGLRDIEFSVQLLQLVHGRMDENLRVASTLDAIEKLTTRGYIGRDTGANLAYTYQFLRSLEHCLQLSHLRRTHTLPPFDDYSALRELARAAHIRSSDEDIVDTLLKEIKKHHQRARAFHEKIFFQPLLDAIIRYDAKAYGLNRESMIMQLAALGFNRPQDASDILAKLLYIDEETNSEQIRAKNIQLFLLPSLLEYLSTVADPDRGLYNYWRLAEKLKSARWPLRLIRDHPIVAERLMIVLGSSEYAASLIFDNPEIIKSYIDTPVGPELLNTSAREAAWAITNAVYQTSTAVEAIALARRLRKVELARIASADILGMLTVPEVCSSLSQIWSAVIQCAIQAVMREEAAMNPVAGTIAVIGMGRLGGWELGYGSDADVLFVCEPADGFTDVQAVNWAQKIVEKMRRLLSVASQDPPLVVDVNLRPEGKNGPLVRTLDSYAHYYENWADTWEIQALLRANYIAGDQTLGFRFLWMVDRFRYPENGISPERVHEIQRMKVRIDHERLPMGEDPMTHTKLGRGGLVDIEWTAQILQLRFSHKISALHTTSTLDALNAIGASELLPEQYMQILQEAWIFVTKTRNALVLVKGRSADQLPASGAVLCAVAGLMGWSARDSQGFLNHYLNITRKARLVATKVLESR